MKNTILLLALSLPLSGCATILEQVQDPFGARRNALITQESYTSFSDKNSGRKVDMEAFSIVSPNTEDGLGSAHPKDQAYIIAAEVALQRQFSHFIVYDEKYNDFCPKAQIILSGSCRTSVSLSILLFNNYDDVKSGILANGKPFQALYESKSEPWKNYFDAKEVAERLRQKHGLMPIQGYRILKYQAPDSVSPDVEELKKRGSP